jgi:hypothetical protein
MAGGGIFATQATFYDDSVTQPLLMLSPKPLGGGGGVGRGFGRYLGSVNTLRNEGITWCQNFHLHSHERFILRCGRHNATLRVKAHWVSSTFDSTQCHRRSVDGRWIPRLPYHTTDLYYTYIVPFLIYFPLFTLCHTTMLLPLQFYTVVTSTKLRHQT